MKKQCFLYAFFLVVSSLRGLLGADAETLQYDQVKETADYIRERWNKTPEVGIILGTGLGQLIDAIDVDLIIPYKEIPHFPVSTVKHHNGQLVLGTLEGKTVIAMQGRVHLYEGYSAQKVAFPIYVMKELGANTLFVSNASGGLNPQFKRGDIMLIEDHINLMAANPLIGANDERLGVRFPDMLQPYSHELIEKAEQAALPLGIKTQKGVYVGLLGPNFETRAEYRFLRIIGGDAVGMSTVPEVIAAIHAKMEVLGISVITDMGLPDVLEPVDLEIVNKAAFEATGKMTAVAREVIKNLD